MKLKKTGKRVKTPLLTESSVVINKETDIEVVDESVEEVQETPK